MKRFSRSLYLQVITAVIIGALVGHLYPAVGTQMKPLGEGFIKLVKMLIAPIVFSTVVTGIAKMGDLKKVGRVGLKGIIYFEVLTTIALAIGLLVGKVLVPGAGMNVNPATLDTKAIASYTAPSAHLSTMDFVMNIIPKDVADAFARGEILQVLFFSILFGVALAGMKGDYAKVVLQFIDGLSGVLFKIVGIVMRVAPIGAFGAMAFTVGKYGVKTLVSLAKLIGTFYTTSVLFVFLVLGLVMLICRLNIFKFLRYIKEEILIVLGTSSSESALPLMMRKMEKLGCGKPVVGLVVPMGYSFNLDGTSIYLTLATLFIAQATNTHVTMGQELEILAVLLLTSKGAAAVTGGGFITLAATLSAVGNIPVAGLTLLLGVDRFMSEARAITNLIGNGVASVAVSRWEGELDVERARAMLDRKVLPEAIDEAEPEALGVAAQA
ncbi:dicarboxylate/amino acid:cation symporter [Anaeromyxobacter diazotrophicus]|uniref:C4-dicarboxylate transport protein n=1 Tax=Anaeromyxobacter diazotrophicus TaxID=2590199 RepID=A0A7I9VJG0_9BACT|nr:dicarboxylate/amino acid:cation symporter [Anaeromyxobacter diazotrophicus]GEJ56552.1 C4-dicarboxylate transport protein [Anaeromyxobacter diazotrophicus]